MDTTVERIQSLQQQITKELDNLKTDLAKQLDTACKTYQLLVDLGQKDIWNDPQYAEYVSTLGIQEKSEKPKVDGITVQDAILKSLSDGKEHNIKNIATVVEELMGKTIKIAGINQGLLLLKKKKAVASTGRGIYRKL